MIKLEQLKKICPNNKQPEALLEALNNVLPDYEINTKKRVACFLAQGGHESAQFSILKENLNYSDAGLCKVWPKRFPSLASAKPYNRNPEKIANKVYADRLGNGSEATGDGFKYRGRGAIQLTGKSNYSVFAQSIGKTLDEAVKYCETLEGAIASACFFWKNTKLNQYADSGDFTTLTKRINGGTIGLADRQHHYEVAMSVLDDVEYKKPAPVVTDVVAPVIVESANVVVPVVAETVVEHHDAPIHDDDAVEKDDDWLDNLSNWFTTPLF